MEKLTNFYLQLSIDADKMAKFNFGKNQQEITQNRKLMLESAGIDSINEIISLDQEQLHTLLTKHLDNSEQWHNLKNHAGNTNNTNNNIGKLGKRKH